MKVTMRDFFEAYEKDKLTCMPSAERVKVRTMEKICNTGKSRKHIPRIYRVAAVIAAVLAVSAAVYAASGWAGFEKSGGMRADEIQEVLDVIESSGNVMSVDADGTVRFFDSYGNETMKLSAEEARQFEQALEENRDERNQEAAGNLLDVGTLELTPRSITPVATGENGVFADCILGNGSMVILCGEDQTGYRLSKGDTVTVSFDASNACIMEFGAVQDGRMLETSSAKSQSHVFSYVVPEDGLYCFTLTYCGSDADNIMNGKVEIN